MQNLNKLKEDIKKWLKTLESDKGSYKFAAHSIHPHSVDATTLAVDLEQMLQNNLEEKKEETLRYLDFHQDCSTGFFKEDFENELEGDKIPRIVEMARTYLSFQTIGAYRSLKTKPRFEFVFYKPYRTFQKMQDYINNKMPWNRSPWGAGGMVDSVSTMLTMNMEMGFDYSGGLRALFSWLEKNQDGESGLWGDQNAQGLVGMVNGGYHITRGTFFWHQKELPKVKKIIDSLITHIKTCQIFREGKGDGCFDIDSFFFLQQCHKQNSKYRRDEIEALAEKRLGQILRFRQKDGGFSFEPHQAEVEHNYFRVTEGKMESDIQGTVFYLQTILSILNILGDSSAKIFHNSLTHGIGERM